MRKQQAKVTLSTTVLPEVNNLLIETAHQFNMNKSEAIQEAILQWLKDRRPEMWTNNTRQI